MSRKKRKKMKQKRTQRTQPKQPDRPVRLTVGTRVKRGPDWRSGAEDCIGYEDKNPRRIGTVIQWNEESKDWFPCWVDWGDDRPQRYRWGHTKAAEGHWEAGHYYDLEVATAEDIKKADAWLHTDSSGLVDELLGLASAKGAGEAKSCEYKSGDL